MAGATATVAVLNGLDYCLPMDEALRRFNEHEARRMVMLNDSTLTGEPVVYSRRIVSKPLTPPNGKPKATRPPRKKPPQS